MADRDRPLLADAKEEIARLGADLQEMARLRWQLVRLEWQAGIGSVKRLAIALAVAVTMASTALPILAVWAAELLGQRTGLTRSGWLLIFGLGLLSGAALTGWLAWRGFRRRFVGLEETLEELREDAVWFREWAGRGEEGRGGGDQAGRGED